MSDGATFRKKTKFKKNNVKTVHCGTKTLTFIGTKVKKNQCLKSFNTLVKESVLISWMLL